MGVHAEPHSGTQRRAFNEEPHRWSSDKVPDEENPAPSRVCAVIITYRPDAGVPQRARLIADQVGEVVVVDNGSGSAFDETLLRLLKTPNLTVLRNDTNLGVGAALNQGVQWAKDQGHRWVLLLDQDSVPFETMVADLCQIYGELGAASRDVLLGANFRDINSRKPWLNPAAFPRHSSIDFTAVATSGTLLPISAFDTVGPFRSDLFVDLIDREYCLRARSRGYRIAITVQPLMLHAVGRQTKRRILWRTVWPTNHPPRRRYFYARNTVLLVREYGASDPQWALSAVSGLVKTVILILLFEDRKLSKLIFSARGIIAGLRGRTGNLTAGVGLEAKQGKVRPGGALPRAKQTRR